MVTEPALTSIEPDPNDGATAKRRERLHSIICEARKLVGQSKRGGYGIYSLEGILNLHVSRASVDRATRLLDSLFEAAESREYSLKLATGNEAQVQIVVNRQPTRLLDARAPEVIADQPRHARDMLWTNLKPDNDREGRSRYLSCTRRSVGGTGFTDSCYPEAPMSLRDTTDDEHRSFSREHGLAVSARLASTLPRLPSAHRAPHAPSAGHDLRR